LKNLNRNYEILRSQKEVYKASEVLIEIKTGEAWIYFMQGKNEEALQVMNLAANMEDATEKSPVTPGEVLPARELLGDMLLEMNRYSDALQAYETDIKLHPNRFNGLYGAGLAAEKANQLIQSKTWFSQLIAISDAKNSNRPEIEQVKTILKKYK